MRICWYRAHRRDGSVSAFAKPRVRVGQGGDRFEVVGRLKSGVGQFNFALLTVTYMAALNHAAENFPRGLEIRFCFTKKLALEIRALAISAARKRRQGMRVVGIHHLVASWVPVVLANVRDTVSTDFVEVSPHRTRFPGTASEDRK